MICCRGASETTSVTNGDQLQIATVQSMSEQRIWTAEEMEQHSPNERRDLVKAGFVKDLSKVSPELLDRARRKIETHIAAGEGSSGNR